MNNKFLENLLIQKPGDSIFAHLSLIAFRFKASYSTWQYKRSSLFFIIAVVQILKIINIRKKDEF